MLRTVGGSLLLPLGTQLGTQVGESTPSTPLTPILRTSCQACACSSAEKEPINNDLQFLDALASLKTMLDIQSETFSRFQDSRVLQSITECYRVLQSVTKCYSVLQSITEYYRVLQCYRILQCDRVIQSIAE